MTSTKFDREKFNGNNDFGLWCIKMRALLVHQGLDLALKKEKELQASLSFQEKADLLHKARIILILNSCDLILRKVAKKDTSARVWSKLEFLYWTKTLVSRVFLKQSLYAFKMMEDGDLESQLDAFEKIIQDLENIGMEIDYEYQTLLLISSLPRSYSNFVDTLVYGRESLSTEDVQSAVRSKNQKIN